MAGGMKSNGEGGMNSSRYGPFLTKKLEISIIALPLSSPFLEKSMVKEMGGGGGGGP